MASLIGGHVQQDVQEVHMLHLIVLVPVLSSQKHKLGGPAKIKGF